MESRDGLHDPKPETQPEAFRVSFVADASTPSLPRLQLRNALTGNQLRFTDVATDANGWSFPAKAFDVKNLTGQYVSVIGHDNIEKQEKLKVTAVLTRDGEVAPGSYPLSIVDQEGWVRVLTGDEILPFRGLTHTCKKEADLSLIKTPQTPSPRSEREEELADKPACLLDSLTAAASTCPPIRKSSGIF